MKIYQSCQLNCNYAIKTLLSRKLWSSTLVLVTIFVTTISLVAPVIAEIIRPSRDFFNQGREQLEREIQILQESPNTPENQQKKPEPILQISPSPDNERKPNPKPTETPIPIPSQSNNSRSSRPKL